MKKIWLEITMVLKGHPMVWSCGYPKLNAGECKKYRKYHQFGSTYLFLLISTSPLSPFFTCFRYCDRKRRKKKKSLGFAFSFMFLQSSLLFVEQTYKLSLSVYLFILVLFSGGKVEINQTNQNELATILSVI